MSQTATILVVEDDFEIRECMIELLRDERHAVVTAENGQQALDLLEAGLRPCVILLDLMMPIMDGWEFRRRQRARPDLATIPVVVVTGAGVETRGADLDPFQLLTKPFDLDRLLETVERICLGAAAPA